MYMWPGRVCFGCLEKGRETHCHYETEYKVGKGLDRVQNSNEEESISGMAEEENEEVSKKHSNFWHIRSGSSDISRVDDDDWKNEKVGLKQFYSYAQCQNGSSMKYVIVFKLIKSESMMQERVEEKDLIFKDEIEEACSEMRKIQKISDEAYKIKKVGFNPDNTISVELSVEYYEELKIDLSEEFSDETARKFAGVTNENFPEMFKILYMNETGKDLQSFIERDKREEIDGKGILCEWTFNTLEKYELAINIFKQMGFEQLGSRELGVMKK